LTDRSHQMCIHLFGAANKFVHKGGFAYSRLACDKTNMALAGPCFVQELLQLS
jgi:hypothetical protein